MASESAARPVNGNHGSINSYSSGDQHLSSHATAAGAPNSGSAGTDALGGPQTSASASATSAEGTSSVPKDEVGWYFVEQYYTTLSKNPEKLHVSLVSALWRDLYQADIPLSSFTTSVPNLYLESRLRKSQSQSDNGYVKAKTRLSAILTCDRQSMSASKSSTFKTVKSGSPMSTPKNPSRTS